MTVRELLRRSLRGWFSHQHIHAVSSDWLRVSGKIEDVVRVLEADGWVDDAGWCSTRSGFIFVPLWRDEAGQRARVRLSEGVFLSTIIEPGGLPGLNESQDDPR